MRFTDGLDFDRHGGCCLDHGVVDRPNPDVDFLAPVAGCCFGCAAAVPLGHAVAPKKRDDDRWNG